MIDLLWSLYQLLYFIFTLFYFIMLGVLGFELRASRLLGRYLITWAMPTAHLFFKGGRIYFSSMFQWFYLVHSCLVPFTWVKKTSCRKKRGREELLHGGQKAEKWDCFCFLQPLSVHTTTSPTLLIGSLILFYRMQYCPILETKIKPVNIFNCYDFVLWQS
jgi:hypothetical protein